ncbi:unnamed protein product [Heligmosomoides polygyrus]|uniref:Uncharacterized protein n=1 Tax=Heligmosomoides polygyrus TaxID=6339 RepID=A0A183G3U9_HELPZ|nr:unnamed protein product [Heligmosomoides polygyrus]
MPFVVELDKMVGFQLVLKSNDGEQARVEQSEAAPTVACTRYQVPGSDFPPRPSKPSIPPVSVNRYQTTQTFATSPFKRRGVESHFAVWEGYSADLFIDWPPQLMVWPNMPSQRLYDIP